MTQEEAWRIAYLSLKPVRARQITKQAIIRGILVRQPCEVCGGVKTQAHHEDYDRPLDVRWLCRTHHWECHPSRKPSVARLNKPRNLKPLLKLVRKKKPAPPPEPRPLPLPRDVSIVSQTRPGTF